MTPARDIERVTDMDPARFAAEYQDADRPVVLAGAARSWPALVRWTPDNLRTRLGGVAVRYKSSSCNAHPDFRQAAPAQMFARGQGTFAEFLDRITAGPRAERARWLFTGDEHPVLRRRDGTTTVSPELGTLLADAPTPELFEHERLYSVWAWFSGPGVRTWLHYDNNGCHNLNAQVTGTKRCVLYAPAELHRMAPFPLGGANPAHNCSQVDVDAVDPARFPQFAHAQGHAARLEPGDVLFIPAWWFHTFAHEGEFNSNLNFWWKPARPRLNPVAERQAVLDAAAKLAAEVAGS